MPEKFIFSDDLEKMGSLVRTETDKRIVSYEFNLESNELNSH